MPLFCTEAFLDIGQANLPVSDGVVIIVKIYGTCIDIMRNRATNKDYECFQYMSSESLGTQLRHA